VQLFDSQTRRRGLLFSRSGLRWSVCRVQLMMDSMHSSGVPICRLPPKSAQIRHRAKKPEQRLSIASWPTESHSSAAVKYRSSSLASRLPFNFCLAIPHLISTGDRPGLRGGQSRVRSSYHISSCPGPRAGALSCCHINHLEPSHSMSAWQTWQSARISISLAPLRRDRHRSNVLQSPESMGSDDGCTQVLRVRQFLPGGMLLSVARFLRFPFLG
jgi:hypothetical protein